MGVLFKRYKLKFRFALKPFFVMINDKKNQMDANEWRELITQTKSRILANPVEFLGDDLPDPLLMEDILNDIFNEFLREKAFLARSVMRMRP